MRGRAAVIRFPGVNCETETLAALREVGLDAEIVGARGGEELLEQYGGFVLPGGFSYQDRVRGGVIASRDPVMDVIGEAAHRGLPVLGICNGAQILVEAGLVPELEEGRVEVALAPNRMPGRTGYHCDWVHLVHAGGPSFLGRAFAPGEGVPLPVAHGEGRFVSAGERFFDRLLEAGRIPLRYASADGTPARLFPECPNGSTLGAAALCNGRGNVVAMMPHPERAFFVHHVPGHLPAPWGEKKSRAARGDLFGPGPGRPVFAAFAAAVREGIA